MLIKRYRDISQMGDVDAAIEDVVNDAIANLDDEKPVKLNLDRVNQSATVKKAIVQEFDGVLRMLDFNVRAQDYFRRWYIDGRIFFHKVIDTEKQKEGIKDVRYVDPRKIRKVREIKKEKDKKNNITLVKDVQEYFVFDEKGIATNNQLSYRTDVVLSLIHISEPTRPY